MCEREIRGPLSLPTFLFLCFLFGVLRFPQNRGKGEDARDVGVLCHSVCTSGTACMCVHQAGGCLHLCASGEGMRLALAVAGGKPTSSHPRRNTHARGGLRVHGAQVCEVVPNEQALAGLQLLH